MKHGAYQAIEGMLVIVSDPELDAKSRKQCLNVLNHNVPAITRHFSKDLCEPLLLRAKSLLQRFPSEDTKMLLKAFKIKN